MSTLHVESHSGGSNSSNFLLIMLDVENAFVWERENNRGVAMGDKVKIKDLQTQPRIAEGYSEEQLETM
jgi:hypothetical protein